jgi:hypothetical protein
MMGVLGGMMGPSTDDARVMPVENSRSYPLSIIPCISTLPSPLMSATALPDMPANRRLAKMLTCPSPPRIHPTLVSAKLKIRFEMSPEFMNAPARLNRGKARRMKEVMPPLAMVDANTAMGMPVM